VIGPFVLFSTMFTFWSQI